MHIVALMDKLIAQDKREEVSERRLAISRFITISSIWMMVVKLLHVIVCDFDSR